MSLIVTSLITWIPAECGGRTSPPNLGLRPTIRFQRNTETWLKIAWDVQITHLDISQKNGTVVVKLRFSEKASPDMTYVQSGELIELLEAYRVIGVGKILTVEDK